MSTPPAASDPLASRYAGLVCDLDGVVYRGPDAVPGAVEALGSLQVPVVYATNNASRPPTTVAEHLASLGVRLELEDVVTSAQAGAEHLARLLGPGASVLAVGGAGVHEALTGVGLVIVVPSAAAAGTPVSAVLQGYGPAVTANDLAEAAYAVAGGALWVATNTDLTLPTNRGTAPGNGTMIAAVRQATGVEPYVVGKPEAPLYRLCADRTGQPIERLLAVGDRLDTDIAGAVTAGLDSVLVLTGVDTPVTLVGATAAERPTYVVRDLAGVHEPYAAAVADDGGWRSDGVRCSLAHGSLQWSGDPASIGGIRAGTAVLHEAVDAGTLDTAAAVELARTVW